MSGRWCAKCRRYTLFGCCRIHCQDYHSSHLLGLGLGLDDRRVREAWRQAEEQGR